MENKVRVYGKAQNRIALGIVNAYIVMNPQATLDDLRQAFPVALNPDSGVKVNFKEIGEQVCSDAWKGFFDREDEVITTGDGKKVALVSMWTKPSFERLVSHAEQYGIEVVKLDAPEKGQGRKGTFRLEYINGFTPSAAEEKQEDPKNSNAWIWILLAVVAIGVIIFLLLI